MTIERTAKLIEQISDSAKFEELAMAVLRRINPFYSGLIHTGCNTDGKTVKSPVDGIFALPGIIPPHFIIAHHTTCKRGDLEKKWLYKKKKSTDKTPDGDITKAIQWAQKERKKTPKTEVTLVLTWNQIPPEQLIADTKHLCSKEKINLDILECSRLQDFLDVDSDGQFLRKKYLGVEQERLSWDYLKEISNKNCDHYKEQILFSTDESLWVKRNADERLQELTYKKSGLTTFYISDSGLGKSTACYQILRNHINNGGVGLWIHPSFIENAVVLESAIDATLKEFYPTLEDGSGHRIAEIMKDDATILIILDDINRTPQPSILVEKIISWSKSAGKQEDSSNGNMFGILCPVWPQVMNLINEQSQKYVNKNSFYGGPFSEKEGGAAVKKYSEEKSVDFSDLQAIELSDSLGHDPFLIRLWGELDESGLNASGVGIMLKIMKRFLDKKLTLVVNDKNEFLASEYLDSLSELMNHILIYKNFSPLWNEVSSWFGEESGTLKKLRNIANCNTIFKLEGSSDSQRITFVHDRIRDYLLSLSIYGNLQNDDALDDILQEPHYAELIAFALMNGPVSDKSLEKVKRENPLALFCALHLFGKAETVMEKKIVDYLHKWIVDNAGSDQMPTALWNAAISKLSITDSPVILPLLKKAPNSTGYWALVARFRNGDLIAGALFCLHYGPEMDYPWRDLLIKHIKAHYGNKLIEKMKVSLSQNDMPENIIAGLLNLSGHLAESSLLPAIKSCSDRIQYTPLVLPPFIWAISRCSKGDPSANLDQLFEYWASLPEETDNATSRVDIAEYSLRFALSKETLHEEVIKYYVKKAKGGPLEWPLTYILQHLDHPKAISFIAQSEAEVAEKSEGGDSLLFSLRLIRDHWDSEKKHGRRLCDASMDCLQALWQPESNNKYLRQQAFAIWSASAWGKHLVMLKTIDSKVPFYKDALVKRMKLGDKTVNPEVLQKISTSKHASCWWQFCDRCWDGCLKEGLDQYFTMRATKIKLDWSRHGYGSDDMTSRLLTDIPIDDAEDLLVKHWAHLKFDGDFVQVALYISTPSCRQLAADTIKECPEPKELLKHLGLKFGFMTSGRQEKITLRQLGSLVPYLDLMGEHTIAIAWQACNRRGFFAWRKKYLDERLSDKWKKSYLLTEVGIFEGLDELLSREKINIYVDTIIDELQLQGMSNDEIMVVVKKWLNGKRTVKAFYVASQCVEYYGSRKDLDILYLNWLPNDDEEVKKIRDNASYFVKRRTLLN